MANPKIVENKDNKDIDPIVHNDPARRVIVDGKVFDTDGHEITKEDANKELEAWVNGLEDQAVLLEINRLTRDEELAKVKRIGDATDKDANRKYLHELKKAELRGK